MVTSDGLEQRVTMGQGAIRMSSRDFKAEVERVNEHLRENYLKNDSENLIKTIKLNYLILAYLIDT